MLNRGRHTKPWALTLTVAASRKSVAKLSDQTTFDHSQNSMTTRCANPCRLVRKKIRYDFQHDAQQMAARASRAATFRTLVLSGAAVFIALLAIFIQPRINRDDRSSFPDLNLLSDFAAQYFGQSVGICFLLISSASCSRAAIVSVPPFAADSLLRTSEPNGH